jgi:zinc D-Ala-D-Ala carboxypeptidase
MKILIIKNHYPKKLNFKKGIEHLEKNAPIKLSIEEIETDFDLEFKKVGNDTFSGVVPTNYYDKLRKLVPENKYNAVVLVYGNDAQGIRVSITENEPLYKNTDVVSLAKVTDGGSTLNHELFHCFFKKLVRRGIVLHDPMDVAIINGQGVGYYNDKCLDCKESNRTIALQALKPYWNVITDLSSQGVVQSVISTITNAIKPSVTSYKYFKDSEVVGLKPELVKKLDEARGLAGTPFKITSGLRTIAENKKAGGVEDSSHLSGLACDIACPTSDVRWKIINALLKAGFTRIGIGETFVHCDVDTSKSGNVIWHYYK